MLSVEQACERIGESVERAEPRTVPLTDAIDLTLAEEIRCPEDSPPFDKALMDGYAVAAADCLGDAREFEVIGEILAGHASERALQSGQVLRIMTGAPIPAGADCVVPFERSRELSPGKVVLTCDRAKVGSNLARRGTSCRAGDLVLRPGVVLGPTQIGALAEMGQTAIRAIPLPTVAILATGDELVPYAEQPGPGQIRNSNELMLTAQCRHAGAIPRPLGIARDTADSLRAAIRQGLEADILCLSGGVSAGKRDLVPAALTELGAVKIFHGCDVKPGKPIWFGELPEDRSADGRRRWIFGLPGNPVSSMVCFELFVRTAIRLRRGIAPAFPALVPATLTRTHVSTDSRVTFFPAILSLDSEGLQATPLPWKGSFDLQTTTAANAAIRFAQSREFAAGERVSVLPLGRGMAGM